MRRHELLSPVGNMEMFYQAVHNGADAVYLAGSQYGARKFADNFSREDLCFVIKEAHLYGVRVYVTVNTLIYENEVEDVVEYIEFLYQHGVDAVIMQDIGLIWLVRTLFPDLEVHASTQCHTHQKEGALFFRKLGLTRVVFAREMSFSEIEGIDVDIEKEVFVYGALCVCYSGCCLFSSLNGGRSGNRGECVGSCRLPYQLLQDGKVISSEGEYLLSTRELNTLDHLKELMDSSVDSFKIEGRMKSPAYVGYVTRLYRTFMDKYDRGEAFLLSEEEKRNLKKLFHRGFTNGYLFSDPVIMNIQTPNHQGVAIGKVLANVGGRVKIQLTEDVLSQNDGIRFQKANCGMMVNRLYDKKGLLVSHLSKGSIGYLDVKGKVSCDDVILKTVDSQFVEELKRYSLKKIPISMSVKCFLGTLLVLEITDGIHTVTEFGKMVEKALNREVTRLDIEKQMKRLGNTPFDLNELKIEKDEGIFLSIKGMNEVRRRAIEKMICLRKNSNVKVMKGEYPELISGVSSKKVCIHVLVRNEEQLLCCLENNVDSVYVTDYSLYQKYRNLGNVYYRVSRVNSNYLNLSGEKLLVGEIGSVEKYGKSNTLIGDYYLNVCNRYSVSFLRKHGVERITLSVELQDHHIRDIMKDSYPVELIVYGRLELMVMKYCPLKQVLHYCKECSKSHSKFSLKDKSGNVYPMVRENCLTHVMHSKIVDRLDRIKDYQDMGINHFRLEFFDEDVSVIRECLDKCREHILSEN